MTCLRNQCGRSERPAGGPATRRGSFHWSGRTSGGAHDFIGGSSGDDHLFGGPEHDTCNGGPNTDTASQCEYVLEVP